MSFKPQHILVPVAVGAADDLHIAEALVDAAADLALMSGGRMTLVYVDSLRTALVPFDAGLTTPAMYTSMAELAHASREAANTSLTSLRARVDARGAPSLHVDTKLIEVISGSGEAIAGFARESDVDLIVLSSHGRRGLKRLFLGSVAERVAHLSNAAVLILHPSAAAVQA